MKIKVYVIIAIQVVCLLFLIGCSGTKNEPKATATAVPTAKATATPSPEPTASPTPKPTLVPLTEAQKGVPQPNATVLFEDNFDEDNTGVDYYLNKGEFITVENGKLTVDPTSWAALIPDVPYDLGVEHSQYEMTVTYSATEGGGAAWSSLFLGCRGPVNGQVPIATDDGYFWVAFNGTGKAFVYPGGGGTYKQGNGSQWNYKYFEITLPEDFIGKSHKITVVDCGDVICYYMNTASSEQYLIVKAVFEGEELICYGNDGAELHREKSILGEPGSFILFNHNGKTILDDITIKGLA